MYGKPIRVLAAAILTVGLASAAFAAGNAPAAPSQQPQSPMQGQGMMGGGNTANGQGMMEGGGNMMGMMGMMSAMTRMANTCNRMMETAMKPAASPGQTTSKPLHNN